MSRGPTHASLAKAPTRRGFLQSTAVAALAPIAPCADEPGGVALVWMGNPGTVKINGRLIPSRGRLVKSDTYAKGQASMVRAFAEQWSGPPLDGPVRIRATSYWPRVHRSGAAKGLAFGDFDAPLKALADALEAAGVLASDAQVTGGDVSKAHDKHNPRIEVVVIPATRKAP